MYSEAMVKTTRQLGPPPGFPWQALDTKPDSPSYLCFYYSSTLSALPVRDVNRTVPMNGRHIADCKVDPNLETQTFGLFSTCQVDIRRGIVKGRSPYMFFFGNHAVGGSQRGVTGYYRLKWYAHGGTYEGDYCLAADKVHFVKEPLSFEYLNAELGLKLSARRPRLAMKVDHARAAKIVTLLEQQPDSTSSYIQEIKRLEKINARVSGGYRYVNFRRRDSYDWTAIMGLSSLGTTSASERITNKDPKQSWVCTNCGMQCISGSPLKLCPNCNAQGTLKQP